jgi:hypothetical protein
VIVGCERLRGVRPRRAKTCPQAASGSLFSRSSSAPRAAAAPAHAPARACAPQHWERLRDQREHLAQQLRPRGMPIPGPYPRAIHDSQHAPSLAVQDPQITQPGRKHHSRAVVILEDRFQGVGWGDGRGRPGRFVWVAWVLSVLRCAWIVGLVENSGLCARGVPGLGWARGWAAGCGRAGGCGGGAACWRPALLSGPGGRGWLIGGQLGAAGPGRPSGVLAGADGPVQMLRRSLGLLPGLRLRPLAAGAAAFGIGHLGGCGGAGMWRAAAPADGVCEVFSSAGRRA